MGVVFCLLFRYQGDFLQSLPFPVVDRPCLVLVRHCRKKKKMRTQGLVEAAGLRGRQNWALILSSSARVCKVTVQIHVETSTSVCRSPPLPCGAVGLRYALDGSEFPPCYLVWPQREQHSYVLLDTATTDILILDATPSFRALGMQHYLHVCARMGGI